MINKDILIRGDRLPEGFEKFFHQKKTTAKQNDRNITKTGFVVGLIKKAMQEK